VPSPLKALVAKGTQARRMSSDCTCGDKRFGQLRSIAYDDGWYVTCLSCGKAWVEWPLSATPSSPRA
jgi:hypothetical protein